MGEIVVTELIHPSAIVEEGATIGANTRICAFVHVYPGAVIGADCDICDHTFIENDVRIGNRCTIKCGVQLWDGISLDDDVFVGPNAAFTNDKFPRSKSRPDSCAKTCLKRGVSVGANATILPGLCLGEKAVVGAGAVVTHNVPPNAIVVGNPARIVGYVDTPSKSPVSEGSSAIVERSLVADVRIIRLHHVKDMRGDLCVSEWYRDLPFVPRRVFVVYNVPDARIRGEHAHKECQEFLVCVKGSMAVVVDDGRQREEYVLDEPWVGLYLPPNVWRIQYRYSRDAVSMVLASHEYDPADYIRNYEEFLRLRQP